MIIWLIMVSIVAVIALIAAIGNTCICRSDCPNDPHDNYIPGTPIDIYTVKDLQNKYEELNRQLGILYSNYNYGLDIAKKLDTLITHLKLEYKPESTNQVPAHFEKKK